MTAVGSCTYCEEPATHRSEGEDVCFVHVHPAARKAGEHHDLLYEKCAECHLFVEPNDQPDGWEYADYIHLHRGDYADERLDATHEAHPSGLKATLSTWQVYGPSAMRERFVVKP